VLPRGYGTLGLPCDTAITARPGPGGTALLRIEAPCQPSQAVTLSHGALTATYLSSSSGIVETVFPAFDDSALYTARLADGTAVEVTVRVPGAAAYERMITMWEGDDALLVHAFEFGADIGSAGHVWRGAPRAAAVADAGRGGFLLSLGTHGLPGAHQAEVYSFPVGETARAGVVRIALGAEIGPATCGRQMTATTLQLGRDLPGAPVAVTLTLPDCGGQPGDLMLKNLARDLKIAAN
jgi:hypothetical protein